MSRRLYHFKEVDVMAKYFLRVRQDGTYDLAARLDRDKDGKRRVFAAKRTSPIDMADATETLALQVASARKHLEA
jgi:hypothetical protein